ncbi:MAG: DUF4832 domain-containing protein [Dysgonamonadaceae bacterium]|jgi:hypothetical protein|nr:DUF4832 domain-containing protein [Dysgonamonadaceae bacterium]
MKQIILTLILLTACISFTTCTQKIPESTSGEKITSVTYEPSDAKFPNPERGFYKYSDCNLGTGANRLNESSLRLYRDNNITLLFRYFYLKNFKNSDLSEQALSEFDTDMATIRRAGMKCVLRFAYSSSETEPDAPLAIIKKHLDQLKPYLEKNVDVIYVMQAGFIGAWGEWYYTTNNLYNAGARYEVINKILQTLPANRYVQLRTPAYKKEFTQRQTPLKPEEAFSGVPVARIAHHNDCFLASENDYGTYNPGNIEGEKDYLNKDCLFVPIGGETCPPDGISPADGLKAYTEMSRLHFSFLNDDYYNPVNSLWKAGNYMDKIIKELGYRFQLYSAECTAEASQGSEFNVRIILKNIGFAPLYNERKVELILKNAQTNVEYVAKLDIDPRSWRPNIENALEAKIGIPQNIPNGDYRLYLNLPDAAATLHNNPDYSVRLANNEVWDAATGYNNLLLTVAVKTGSGMSAYTGNVFFKQK